MVPHSPEPNAIYQTATMEALLDGVYDGDVMIRELLSHGDFGLGTFNGLDGEMLMLDSVCYQLRSDGSAEQAGPDELVPFAVVTRFRPQQTIEVTEESDRATVTTLVDERVESANLMVAVRIRGDFASVRTRTVSKQHAPYPPFTEATRDQGEVTMTDVSGTLGGFRMPQWVQGISVAGYHAHFLDANRARGGHALDYRLRHGTVEVSVCSDLHLSLPRTPQFEAANLSDDDADEQIRRTEGH
ncbi:acetolactate decarboxylase [Mycobacterium sp. NPDC006124]|uniref:acetolactate decarboxylase n=1 Tax=Mycobacterium sp. NPDC006124 TaxID=3156729 RepID=UPI0033BED4CD